MVADSAAEPQAPSGIGDQDRGCHPVIPVSRGRLAGAADGWSALKAGFATLMLLLPVSLPAQPNRWEVSGSLTGVYHHGSFDQARTSAGASRGDTGRGSVALDLESTLQIGTRSRLFAAASLAEGNGLDGAGGVSVRVNADDLEDDLENINGRSRDYLREAWYAFDLAAEAATRFRMTAGIIDATRYIDLNRAANDELHQFMNEVFVNRFFLPSYDPGIAVAVDGETWSVHGVWMNTRAETVDGGYDDFDFFGLDVGIRYQLAAGEGTGRVILLTTSDAFGEDDSNVHGAGFSIDQNLGQHVMAFARAGVFNEEPSVLTHKALYSGGLQFSGTLVGRPQWVTGLAYAFLDGVADAPGDVRDTRVWEIYARWNPTSGLGIGLDLQHVTDDLRQDKNPSLWAVGVRINLSL